MPNLLIYAPIIGRGGVHRMVTRLIEHWQNNPNWKIVVLSQTHDENGNEIDWGEAKFIQIDGGTPPQHPYLFTWLQQNQITFHTHWQKVAKQYKIDLTYFPMPWWTTRHGGFKPLTPMVITLHDFAWDQMSIPAHEFRAEARNFAEHADLAIFPSDYQRVWGEQNYGFKHTRTIYHGHFIPPNFLATPSEAARVQAQYRLPSRYTLAFHCANSKKDPITILRAQLEARKRSADVPPLVVAGLDTEWFTPGSIRPGHHAYGFATQLWNVIANCGYHIGEDLFVLGNIPVQDMGGLYAGARAVISASLNEGGVNGTMFEAFAAHVPCVFTNLPMFSERLDPLTDYGFVFEPRDVNGLANTLIEVCTAQQQAEETGIALPQVQNAFAFANSRTWADSAREYLTAFEMLMEAVG